MGPSNVGFWYDWSVIRALSPVPPPGMNVSQHQCSLLKTWKSMAVSKGSAHLDKA